MKIFVSIMLTLSAVFMLQSKFRSEPDVHDTLESSISDIGHIESKNAIEASVELEKEAIQLDSLVAESDEQAADNSTYIVDTNMIITPPSLEKLGGVTLFGGLSINGEEQFTDALDRLRAEVLANNEIEPEFLTNFIDHYFDLEMGVEKYFSEAVLLSLEKTEIINALFNMLNEGVSAEVYASILKLSEDIGVDNADDAMYLLQLAESSGDATTIAHSIEIVSHTLQASANDVDTNLFVNYLSHDDENVRLKAYSSFIYSNELATSDTINIALMNDQSDVVRVGILRNLLTLEAVPENIEHSIQYIASDQSQPEYIRTSALELLSSGESGDI